MRYSRRKIAKQQHSHIPFSSLFLSLTHVFIRETDCRRGQDTDQSATRRFHIFCTVLYVRKTGMVCTVYMEWSILYRVTGPRRGAAGWTRRVSTASSRRTRTARAPCPPPRPPAPPPRPPAPHSEAAGAAGRTLHRRVSCSARCSTTSCGRRSSRVPSQVFHFLFPFHSNISSLPLHVVIFYKTHTQIL